VKSIGENNKLAESTKRKILVVFKTALRQLLNGSPNYASILEAIELPKTENKSVQVFSIKEQRLIEIAALHSDAMEVYGIVLCFYTGIRLGELCALKWTILTLKPEPCPSPERYPRVRALNKGNKTIAFVGTPKSRKSVRKIPLPDFILKQSEGLIGTCARENDYVISGTRKSD
jgi:integrase